MNGPSEEEVDRLERKMIEAMQGSAGSSRKTRGECCQRSPKIDPLRVR